MVQNALPRQLMPRAVTEIALKRIESRKLGRIMEDVGCLVPDMLSVGER